MKITDAKPNQKFRIINGGYGARGVDGGVASLNSELRSDLYTGLTERQPHVKVLLETKSHGTINWRIGLDAQVELMEEYDKTPISSVIKILVGDEVGFKFEDEILCGKILEYVPNGMDVVIKVLEAEKPHLIPRIDIIGLKDNKMQVLSAVNKWKNREFVVYCETLEESNEFVDYVGGKNEIKGSNRCYSWSSTKCTWAGQHSFRGLGIKIITLREFKELQKDDKIGILSCTELGEKVSILDIGIDNWKIIRNFDIEAWKRKEFAVECNTEDDFEKFFRKTKINKAKHIKFIEAFPCIVYAQYNSDGWSRFGDSNHVEIDKIEFKALNFPINAKDINLHSHRGNPDSFVKKLEELERLTNKYDKKKILSDASPILRSVGRNLFDTIKSHDDNFANMAYWINPYSHRLNSYPDIDIDFKDAEKFKREYLGEWNFNDKSVFQFDSTPNLYDEIKSLEIKRKNYYEEFKNYSNPWLIGVDFAKEYDSKWIGKGEEMKKQTLFNKLGVERVWINEEKRSVTVELINGNVATAKADEKDEFCEQTGFANAYLIAKSGFSKTEFKKSFEEEMDYIKKSEAKDAKAKKISELERKQRKEMQKLRKDLNSKK